MSMFLLNLEQGMPTVAQARQRLENGLRQARAKRCSYVKIIHGYGSSGTGGAIKRDVSSFLAGKKRSKAIRNYVSGEEFSPFNQNAREIVAVCPLAGRDKDYTKSNHGITIVLL